MSLGWAMAAAVVWLSLTPSPPHVDVPYSDKLGHFAAYGALMFWFSQIYPARRVRITYAVAFTAMGIGLEFLQGYLGDRTYEVFDMAANAIGVLLGWAAALALPRARFS